MALEYGFENDEEQAIATFDETLSFKPTDADIWYNKGLDIKALGRGKEADAAFTNAKKLGYEG